MKNTEKHAGAAFRTKLKLTTTREHAAQRLDDTLINWLTEALERPVSRAKARKLIMAGAVHLNGRPVRIASLTLPPGARIDAFIDRAKLFSDATSRDQAFELTADRILFEDDALIVVDKPSGLPVHPTADEARDSLVAAVSRFLSRRDESVEPYLGIHQRLDRDTSGVILFTKVKRVNADTARIFSDHLGTKIYQALTIAPSRPRFPDTLKPEWTIKNHLGKIGSISKRARYGAVQFEGDFAETAFRVLEELQGGMRIEAIPKTGRTHQIRAHLSEYGLPILGDDLYGDVKSSTELAPRLMLHATELIFPHPVHRRELSVRSPLPHDFERCLRRIQSMDQSVLPPRMSRAKKGHAS